MKGSLHAGNFVPLAILVPVFAMTGFLCRAPMGVQAQNNPAQPAFYTEKVQPILQADCYRCHGGSNHRGGLKMTTREDMLQGGHHGPGIVPGHPEQSWMVRLIRHEGPVDDPMNMPPAPRPKLSDADIAVIETWIRAGAVMPPNQPTSAASLAAPAVPSTP